MNTSPCPLCGAALPASGSVCLSCKARQDATKKTFQGRLPMRTGPLQTVSAIPTDTTLSSGTNPSTRPLAPISRVEVRIPGKAVFGDAIDASPEQKATAAKPEPDGAKSTSPLYKVTTPSPTDIVESMVASAPAIRAVQPSAVPSSPALEALMDEMEHTSVDLIPENTRVMAKAPSMPLVVPEPEVPVMDTERTDISNTPLAAASRLKAENEDSTTSDDDEEAETTLENQTVNTEADVLPLPSTEHTTEYSPDDLMDVRRSSLRLKNAAKRPPESHNKPVIYQEPAIEKVGKFWPVPWIIAATVMLGVLIGAGVFAVHSGYAEAWFGMKASPEKNAETSEKTTDDTTETAQDDSDEASNDQTDSKEDSDDTPTDKTASNTDKKDSDDAPKREDDTPKEETVAENDSDEPENDSDEPKNDSDKPDNDPDKPENGSDEPKNDSNQPEETVAKDDTDANPNPDNAAVTQDPDSKTTTTEPAVVPSGTSGKKPPRQGLLEKLSKPRKKRKPNPRSPLPGGLPRPPKSLVVP